MSDIDESMQDFDNMNSVSQEVVVYDYENLDDKMPLSLVDKIYEIDSCVICSNNEETILNQFRDQPYNGMALCKEFTSFEEWEFEEDENDYAKTSCHDFPGDFYKINPETFMTSKCEDDFLFDSTNTDIEYESVEFIDINQGYEIDEEDCCFVTSHNILKPELECFIVHEDIFVEKVNDDVSSSYSDMNVYKVDQELLATTMENRSGLEWCSNIDCSDIDICKTITILDGLAYERFSFDLCNEFVPCLQKCFNDEHVIEVQTDEETNFHDDSCITKYEVFNFLFQLDEVGMKLVECCY